MTRDPALLLSASDYQSILYYVKYNACRTSWIIARMRSRTGSQCGDFVLHYRKFCVRVQ